MLVKCTDNKLIARTRDVRHDTGPEATLFQLSRGAHRLVWSDVRVLVTLGMSNVSYKILFKNYTETTPQNKAIACFLLQSVETEI